MKTTLQGLQALQIALRNRVERLPDGSIAIKIKNDFQCVTLGDLAAFVEAASSRIRFSRHRLDSDYYFYFMEMSRNQAKRLRKRLQEWVDSAIDVHKFTQGLQAASEAGFEAGEKLKHMADMYMFDQSKEAIEAVRNFWGEFKDGKRPRSVMKECRLEQMPDIFTQEGRNEIMQQSQAVPPSGFPPSHGNRMAHLIAARKAMEAAKDAEIEQLKAALEAANLTKDGALKTAEKAIAERNNLKTTNAELVRQAQAHNQEAIQLREALDNMTRLRNEALGKSVRLPNEGETIEVKDIFTGAWSEVAAKAFANGRIGVPVKFGVMWTEAPNYGITWRWPAKKERTANIKLTGVLIGSDQNGYTSFFRELPFVSAEGKTVKEAQMNLFETIQFAFEYLQEENPGDQRGENCQEFSAILTLA